MNTRITAVLLSSLLVSQAAFSQTKREILEEDPKEAPNLRLELTPINMTASSGDKNNRAEYGGRLYYRSNNRFAISGEYMRAMIDPQDRNSYYYHGSPNAGYSFEVAGTYFFANKEKEVEEWMPVKSQSVGYRTIQVTVDPLPMTRLALYGVRGGVGKVVASATNYGATLVSLKNPTQVMTDENATSLLSTGYAFAGINATMIKNMKVKYPVYGTRRKQYIREWYLDFIYATSNNNSTVEADENGTKAVYRIDPAAETSKLMKYGARLGFFTTPTGRLVNLGYGFEVGSLPRAAGFSDGIYWNVRLAISLVKKVNKSE